MCKFAANSDKLAMCELCNVLTFLSTCRTLEQELCTIETGPFSLCEDRLRQTIPSILTKYTHTKKKKNCKLSARVYSALCDKS